jgi:hypothetical protein
MLYIFNFYQQPRKFEVQSCCDCPAIATAAGTSSETVAPGRTKAGKHFLSQSRNFQAQSRSTDESATVFSSTSSAAATVARGTRFFRKNKKGKRGAEQSQVVAKPFFSGSSRYRTSATVVAAAAAAATRFHTSSTPSAKSVKAKPVVDGSRTPETPENPEG